jgi:hypothetical protein
MSVRLAAVLIALLPASAGCLASPIGVLVGPFAGQVLAQQRQEAAQGKATGQELDAAPTVVCQPEREAKPASSATAARHQCDIPAEDIVAERGHAELDPLPEPGKKSTAN